MARGSFGGGHVPETDGWRDVLGAEHGLVECKGLFSGIGEVQVGAQLGHEECSLCIRVPPECPADSLPRIRVEEMKWLLPACSQQEA